MNAPIKMAVVPEPGIPSVKRGIMAPPEAALLADSGPATPAIFPLPNESGSLLNFFSEIYEKKEASVAPAPGRTPRKNPKIEERPIGPALCFKSDFVGRIRVILATGSS